MTDDSVEQMPTSNAGAGGELALMTGDDSDTQAIMGKRKAPKPTRNQPPATRVNTGPYTPGAGPRAAERPGVAPVGDQAVAMNAPVAPLANPAQPQEQGALPRGEIDGQACNQRSPGMVCGALRGEALDRCQRDYNQGYDSGARKLEQDLTARGAASGARDRGKANAALSYPEARGSCGNVFVQAYNRAFR